MYQASPINLGFNDIAKAIAGAPERQAKAMLMEAQMKLAEEQALTQGSHRELYGAQAGKARAETDGITLSNQGVRTAADAARDLVLFGPQPPTAPAPGPGGVASAVVNGVGPVAGAAPVPPVAPPGQTIDVGGVANSVVGGPPPAPVAPEPPGPMMQTLQANQPDIVSGVVGNAVDTFQKLPPQTQREIYSRFVQGSVQAGGEHYKNMGDFQLALGAGKNAMTPPGEPAPFDRRQVNDLQTGAKMHTQNTNLGFDTDQQRQRDKAAAEDATRRRGDDLQYSASKYRTDAATGRAGAKNAPKPLTQAESNSFREQIRKSGKAVGQTVTPEMEDAVMTRFYERMAAGEDKVTASNGALNEAWAEVDHPGQEGWKLFSPTTWGDSEKKPSTTTEFALKTNKKMTEEELAAKRGEAPKSKPATVAAPKGVPADPAKREINKVYDNGAGVKRKWTASGWQAP